MKEQHQKINIFVDPICSNRVQHIDSQFNLISIISKHGLSETTVGFNHSQRLPGSGGNDDPINSLSLVSLNDWYKVFQYHYK